MRFNAIANRIFGKLQSTKRTEIRVILIKLFGILHNFFLSNNWKIEPLTYDPLYDDILLRSF